MSIPVSYTGAVAALAYFLTWTTYGTWLRGDQRGSVVGENRHGAPYAEPDPARARFDRNALRSDPVVLNADARRVTAEAIRHVCEHRGWRLHALNVRSNHVHVVVSASATPERVLVDLKAWGTRRLREGGFVTPETRAWTKHGSTRYLFDPSSLAMAVDYVLRQQDLNRTR